MTPPTFSVITVTRNSGQSLRRTAESVAEQSADAEYLIIDGASTDGSLEIAREIAAAGPERIRLISEPDQGVYDAMNKGIAAAQGRYLYFLGTGDHLLPGSLSTIAKLLPAHERAFVYGDVLLEGDVRYDGPFDRRKLCGINICHQAIFYGRDVFRICGNYDLRYRRLADYEFNLRCFGKRSIPKIYVDLVVAYFQLGGGSSLGDEAFERDKTMLIRRHLGLYHYARRRWPQPIRQAARLVRRLVRRLLKAHSPD